MAASGRALAGLGLFSGQGRCESVMKGFFSPVRRVILEHGGLTVQNIPVDSGGSGKPATKRADLLADDGKEQYLVEVKGFYDAKRKSAPSSGVAESTSTVLRQTYRDSVVKGDFARR